MSDSQIIDIVNDIRRKLKMYYYWQVLWASVFLLLVFASSLFFGLRTSRFWAYIIIPLLVTGGFWVFLQTTRESVNIRLNQRIMEVILEHVFDDYSFVKFYNLPKEDFLSARLLPGVHSISARNALKFEIDSVPVFMCYVRVEKNTDRGIITSHAGTYVRVNIDNDLPEFGIYPTGENVKDMASSMGLIKLQTKLDSDFQVWARNPQESDFIEKIGPDLLKYSHTCCSPTQFYFSTFGGKLHLGIFNYHDLMEFPLFSPITDQDITKEITRMETCLEFLNSLVKNVKDYMREKEE